MNIQGCLEWAGTGALNKASVEGVFLNGTGARTQKLQVLLVKVSSCYINQWTNISTFFQVEVMQ